MITGAANAEAALLLIDAHEGVQEQSRRHGYLLNLLGIRQIAVLVNKMDLRAIPAGALRPDRSRIPRLSQAVGVEAKCFIPISAQHGDNIASRSANMPWWHGPTVLEALDEFQRRRAARQTSRCAFPSRTFIASTSAASWPGASSPARSRWATACSSARATRSARSRPSNAGTRPPRDQASAGESIGITLTEQIFVAARRRGRAWRRPRRTN